jgi:AmmeMemoRadiSam system protein A
LVDGQNIDDRHLLLRHGGALLAAAAQAIEFGLKHGRAPKISVDGLSQELQQHRATFVTLTLNNRLRGCVGTLSPRQPLIADAAANGYAAAFRDPRFPGLMLNEYERVGLSITLLGPETELSFADEAALLDQLVPERDGLIIADQGNRAVFLPQVWKNLSDPTDFLVELKLKAGWTRDYWSPTLKAWRFSALTVRHGNEDASSVKVTEDIDEE